MYVSNTGTGRNTAPVEDWRFVFRNKNGDEQVSAYLYWNSVLWGSFGIFNGHGLVCVVLFACVNRHELVTTTCLGIGNIHGCNVGQGIL